MDGLVSSKPRDSRCPGLTYKVRKMPTISKDRTREDEGVRCLFRGYLRYATVFGVVIMESAVGVPLRRVFHYEWMDLTRYRCEEDSIDQGPQIMMVLEDDS
jgi:hypothetical protein